MFDNIFRNGKRPDIKEDNTLGGHCPRLAACVSRGGTTKRVSRKPELVFVHHIKNILQTLLLAKRLHFGLFYRPVAHKLKRSAYLGHAVIQKRSAKVDDSVPLIREAFGSSCVREWRTKIFRLRVTRGAILVLKRDNHEAKRGHVHTNLGVHFCGASKTMREHYQRVWFFGRLNLSIEQKRVLDIDQIAHERVWHFYKVCETLHGCLAIILYFWPRVCVLRIWQSRIEYLSVCRSWNAKTKNSDVAVRPQGRRNGAMEAQTAAQDAAHGDALARS
mmetsp:Transcript_382/g.868  ORF Transcript_382/g.868 Transcript_382/m.868 type:complete len:275 (+) Transcript_382:639-1463(+)